MVLPIDNARRFLPVAHRLRFLKASTDSEIDAALATLAQPRTGGLVVAADPFFNSRREKLVELAARHAVPAIYEWREFAQDGGLISYGPSLPGTYRQIGVYVGGFSLVPSLPTCRSSDRRGSSRSSISTPQGARADNPAVGPRPR